MHDIAIIGGGPGGLYAAYQLASAGYDVAVFEEHPSPGDPVHCTGVLAADAFDEFDLPRESILNTIVTARFFGPSGGTVEYTTPTVEALVVDRRVFDARLHDQAVRAGATVRTGIRVLDVHAGKDGVRLACADGRTVEARGCILACGANYAMQKRLGLGMPRTYLQSAQLELPAAAAGDVEVHFGSDVAPKGFAWAVPVSRDGEPFARIGLMCERDPREYFQRFLERIGPRWQTGTEGALDAGLTPRTKVLPLGPIDKTFTDRILAVGDAAGLVKATTGGGIYYSIVSGNIAAAVLGNCLETGNFSAAALESYETRWRAALGEELDAQMTLRKIADDMSDGQIDALFDLARTDGIMPLVRRTAAFNRHRTLIVSLLSHPPARRVLMRRVLGWGQSA